MSATLLSGSGHASPPLEVILPRCGFSRRGGEWLRGKLRIERHGQWLSLTVPAPTGEDPLGRAGRPGLWKHEEGGEASRVVFPLPVSILQVDESADPDQDVPLEFEGGQSPLEACLRWALATLTGESPEGWQPPGEEALAFWKKDHHLTVQHGSVVRQIEVIRAGGRLSLRVALVNEVPDGLPEARAKWLQALLLDAQSSWHLVRTAITAERAAVAEVELSGLPAAVGPHLFRAALDSLRWVVAGLAETAEFLVDPDVPSQALELCPPPRRSSAK